MVEDFNNIIIHYIYPYASYERGVNKKKQLAPAIYFQLLRKLFLYDCGELIFSSQPS